MLDIYSQVLFGKMSSLQQVLAVCYVFRLMENHLKLSKRRLFVHLHLLQALGRVFFDDKNRELPGVAVLLKSGYLK